jgi:hypothetical protein
MRDAARLRAMTTQFTDGRERACAGCGAYHRARAFGVYQPAARPTRLWFYALCEGCEALIRNGLGVAIAERVERELAPLVNAEITNLADGSQLYTWPGGHP